MAAALIIGKFGFAITGKDLAGCVLDLAVIIMIEPGQQAGIFPCLEPLGHDGIGRASTLGAVYGGNEIQARECANGRGSGVQQGNK